MNKKVIKIVVVGIVIILLILAILCLIDLSRMNNNKPVLFSTWGKSYKVPVEIDTDIKDVKS